MRPAVSLALVMVGMAIGFAAAQRLGLVVSAQSGWQCKSWTLQKQDDVSAVGAWLGQSKTVLLSSNGVAVAWQTNVVACKQ